MYRVSCVGKVYVVIVLLSLHNCAAPALLLDCFWPERFLLPLAADTKSAVSAAQDAACCEAAALHNPAFLAILKTEQQWIDSYIRSTQQVHIWMTNSFDHAHQRISST